MKNLFLFSAIIFSLSVMSCEDPEEDPKLPIITVEDLEINETDSDLSAAISLKLNEASLSNIVFNYSTKQGTATTGIDYKAAENETFTIAAGETSATVNIIIKGDDVQEPKETFEVIFLNPIGATFSSSSIEISILDDDEDLGVVIPSTGYTTPDNYPGMTLVWQDEFDGNTLSDDWNFEVNGDGGGNNELQYYRTENTSLVEGNLVIEAKKENFGGRNYTSSRLTTENKKSFKYGRVDIRAVLPQGQGLWPALWMLGDNISTIGWPACGEIDIMELIGNQPNRVHGTIHWDSNGHANYGQSKALDSGIFADEFHVFSITWDANEIKWYMDDILYNTADITPGDLSEFHDKFFFIFNVAVGGTWPGSPDATTNFPQRMIVDYIRVFQ